MHPYCEHPECHDTRTRGYTRYYTSNGWPSVPGIQIWPTAEVGRRLCRVHALQEFGVA